MTIKANPLLTRQERKALGKKIKRKVKSGVRKLLGFDGGDRRSAEKPKKYKSWTKPVESDDPPRFAQ